jgi:hypothetical protein
LRPGVGHGDELRKRRVVKIGDQTFFEGVDKSFPHLIRRIVRSGEAFQGGVPPLVFFETDEGQSVLRAAASRLLGRDENMDVGMLTIPDIVDEHDFGSDVIAVTDAGGTIEIDIGSDASHGVEAFGSRLSGGFGESRGEDGENHEDDNRRRS